MLQHEQQQQRDRDKIQRMEIRLSNLDEQLRTLQNKYAEVRDQLTPNTRLRGPLGLDVKGMSPSHRTTLAHVQTSDTLEETRHQLRDSERLQEKTQTELDLASLRLADSRAEVEAKMTAQLQEQAEKYQTQIRTVREG